MSSPTRACWPGSGAIPAVLEGAGFAFTHNTVGEGLGYVTADATPA